MTDYSELKRLANFAKAQCIPYCTPNPASVLALIAENERLKKDVEDHSSARLYYCGELGKALGERDQLKAEVEALRKDAERYRCLIHPGGFDYHESWLGMDKSALDAALDEIMTKEQNND